MLRSGPALLVVAAAAIALGVAADIVIDTGSFREWAIRLCILGLFAMSLNLLVGYTGLLSFGHAAFFGVGAYTFCILMQTGKIGIPLAAASAVGLAGVSALVIGVICVRLTHVYFAFITLAIQMLLYSVVIAWSSLTGGEQGLIGGIPRPPFLGVNLGDPLHAYTFNVAVFVASVALMYRIVNSPFGTALRMIRDNPRRALFLGVNVNRYKLAAFVIAGMFSGLAGVLMGLYVSGAYPNFAYWTMSGEGLFMIMLGGAGVFLGPALGAGLLIFLEGMVNSYTGHHGIVLGLIILAVVLGLRRGVLEYASDWLRARRELKAEVGAGASPSSAKAAEKGAK